MRKRSLRIADVAGASAWREGLHPDDNPYPHGRAERVAWEAAYHGAAQAAKEYRAFMRRHRALVKELARENAADGAGEAK